MNKTFAAATLTILTSALGSMTSMTASAAILLDQSFDTTGQTAEFGGLGARNQANGQNFLDDATFGGQVQITGISNFSINPNRCCGAVGKHVVVKIFSNSATNNPGVVLFEVSEQLDVVDSQFATAAPGTQRQHATLTTPIVLSAGTYWFGLSGAPGAEIGQEFLTGVVNGNNAHALDGDNDLGIANSPGNRRATALQVEGNLNPVPIPAAVWLLGGALGGLGFSRRRIP